MRSITCDACGKVSSLRDGPYPDAWVHLIDVGTELAVCPYDCDGCRA